MMSERFSRLLRTLTLGSTTIGLGPTCQWLLGTTQSNLGIALPRFRSLRLSSLHHPVKLRSGSSDFFTFRQIMIENEYQPLKDLPITTILDLGANIGLASTWFLNRFPAAEVFAVEPDPDNYRICRENLAPYGNRVRVLHGAAWASQTILTLRRKSCAADNWMQEAKDNDAGAIQVPGWDIASLIKLK